MPMPPEPTVSMIVKRPTDVPAGRWASARTAMIWPALLASAAVSVTSDAATIEPVARPRAGADRKRPPPRQVHVSAFTLDRTERSNAEVLAWLVRSGSAHR